MQPQLDDPRAPPVPAPHQPLLLVFFSENRGRSAYTTHEATADGKHFVYRVSASRLPRVDLAATGDRCHVHIELTPQEARAIAAELMRAADSTEPQPEPLR